MLTFSRLMHDNGELPWAGLEVNLGERLFIAWHTCSTLVSWGRSTIRAEPPSRDTLTAMTPVSSLTWPTNDLSPSHQFSQRKVDRWSYALTCDVPHTAVTSHAIYLDSRRLHHLSVHAPHPGHKLAETVDCVQYGERVGFGAVILYHTYSPIIPSQMLVTNTPRAYARNKYIHS